MATEINVSGEALEAMQSAYAELVQTYKEYQSQGLSLDMSRGKPSVAQLNTSLPMLDCVQSTSECIASDGTDCRNYGVLTGIPEARKLMSILLDDDPKNVVILGSSSLTIMFDTIARCMLFGTCGSAPWATLEKKKWLCPVPGYDRHFAITEHFGFEMIAIPMNDEGPDMDLIEELVANDASIKGIWCVPKYSNPGGITYSDEVVQRLASMECAAQDFRIFWDNAYCIHHLYQDPFLQKKVLDIAQACTKAGNPNRYYKFASTSKVTFPGAGLAAMAASPESIADTCQHLTVQTIGADKINQLRHVRYLKDEDGLKVHMCNHATILRPKFDKVIEVLEENLGEEAFDLIDEWELDNLGTWNNPLGGYFISFNAPNGCAKRIVELAARAGVKMTNAGATYPYGNDPNDSNIRIAPTMPSIDELETSMEIFCVCVKLATIEAVTECAHFDAMDIEF